MSAVCSLGHTQKAYECPACAEAAGETPLLEHWRWYRGRTSSKRIKALINQRLAAAAVSQEGDT